MLLIRCQCGKKLRLRAEFAGKVGRCPACGRDVQVPKDLPVDGDARAAPDPAPGIVVRGSAQGASPRASESASSDAAEDLPEVDHDALTEHEMKPGVGAAADAWKRDRDARRAATRKATGELPRTATSSASTSRAAPPVSRAR